MALPVIVMLSLGVADGGRAFSMRESVTNATRQALREAQIESASSGAGSAACAGSSGTVYRELTAHVPWRAGDPASMTSISSATALESSSDGTLTGSRINGASLVIRWHCAGGLVVTNATATSTDPASLGSAAIEAKITYNFSLITPLSGALFGSTTPAIRADLVGRANY